MYKVNLPDAPDDFLHSINHAVINLDFEDESGNVLPAGQRWHPIYASPTIIVDNETSAGGAIEYNVLVFFGTGDSPYYDENIDTANTRYHFFAYADKNDKGEVDPTKHILDWYITLEEGHRVFATAFAAAGQIYFGTSTAETEDPCEGHGVPNGNRGRLYAVTKEGNIVLNRVVGDVLNTPLVEDEHLYFRTPAGLESLGSGSYNNEVRASGEAQMFIRSWQELE